MSSASLRADIKNLLAEAATLAGSPSSDLIYVVKSTTTGGGPLGGGTTTEVTTLLPNAIFKGYDAKLFNGTILAGDRMLVCDNVTAIKQGDTIKQGSAFYIVVNVDMKAPTSDALAYIAQVRLK
tara:strand:- start:785 stop:1156 length:372 start_codon:yes stop_codon:yes gene_type:complete